MTPLLESIKTSLWITYWTTSWILGGILCAVALCVVLCLFGLGFLAVNSLGTFRGSSFIPHINP